jgi:hypothetical protein
VVLDNAGAAGEGLGKNSYRTNNVLLFHTNVPHNPEKSNEILKILWNPKEILWNPTRNPGFSCKNLRFSIRKTGAQR